MIDAAALTHDINSRITKSTQRADSEVIIKPRAAAASALCAMDRDFARVSSREIELEEFNLIG